MTQPPVIQAAQVSKNFSARGGFFTKGEPVAAVREVSLCLSRGASFGVLGESGCGKSTLGRLLLGLVKPSSGIVEFEGEDLAGLSPKELRTRRRRMQLIFQDAMGSLNPRMRVGKAVIEPMQVHRLVSGDRGWKETAAELFDRVGLDGSLVTRFAHELSGGQRQRVCIARALASDPALLVADEPVASLDISVQTQILALLVELFGKTERALLMISHDVRVIRALCTEVAVMYLGRIVERAASEELFERPAHPYTKLLLESVPALHPDQRHIVKTAVPSFEIPDQGCDFAPRCPKADDQCRIETPAETESSTGRWVRCFHPMCG
jgi:oligopeptide/dipeptide ABC transporter ATP-binding protein